MATCRLLWFCQHLQGPVAGLESTVKWMVNLPLIIELFQKVKQLGVHDGGKTSELLCNEPWRIYSSLPVLNRTTDLLLSDCTAVLRTLQGGLLHVTMKKAGILITVIATAAVAIWVFDLHDGRILRRINIKRCVVTTTVVRSLACCRIGRTNGWQSWCLRTRLKSSRITNGRRVTDLRTILAPITCCEVERVNINAKRHLTQQKLVCRVSETKNPEVQ